MTLTCPLSSPAKSSSLSTTSCSPGERHHTDRIVRGLNSLTVFLVLGGLFLLTSVLQER